MCKGKPYQGCYWYGCALSSGDKSEAVYGKKLLLIINSECKTAACSFPNI